MVWLFFKDGQELRCEISRDRGEGRYRLVVTHPDGSEQVDEIEQPTELIERSIRLMNALRSEGWTVA